MVVNKIAEELMLEIDVFGHSRIARHIPRAAEITLKYYKQSGLAREYFIDLDEVFICSNRRTLNLQRPNPDHVYEIFGKFSHESPSVVCTSVVDYVTCDPETFKEKLVVVFTMLNLDLNSWLLRTKNPKIPADEAVLYSLCQLYSRHALAYTTGSIWSTLELHGKYSVDELKKHCDIHLVFLEGGILAQLHKKPTIPRLLSVSQTTDLQSVKTSESNVVSVARMTSTPPLPEQGTNTAQDHTYASPVPQVHSDVFSEPSVTDKIQNQCSASDDHSYAELSDVAMEPYEHNSDSQDDIVTTGGKVIISSSDKVEISVEYQCEDTLPEATKDSTTTGVIGSAHDKSSKQALNGFGKVLDKTNNVNSSTNQLLDDTSPNGDMVPDETENKSVLPNATDQNNTTRDALPDETKELSDETENNNNIVDSEVLPDDTTSVHKVLPDKTDINDTVNIAEQRLGAASIISTDSYPDTTRTTSTLREATDITSSEPTTAFAENTETNTTRETVIGEITYTETDTTLSNINENTDSKDNLTLGDIPQGVSGMRPFETSSVISEPMEGDTAANSTSSMSISTSSSSFNKPTLVMNKKEISLAKRNRLKQCIIKLTELSNSDRERWLSGENSSSRLSRTTDSIESSDSSLSR